MTSTIPAISDGTLTSLNAGVQPVSQRIRQRLVDQGISFLANDNVAAFIETGELDELEHEVADRVRELLRSLVIDIDNDHNTAETAERVARMYLREVFKGSLQPSTQSCEFSKRQATRRNLYRWPHKRSLCLFPPPRSNHGELLDRDQAR